MLYFSLRQKRFMPLTHKRFTPECVAEGACNGKVLAAQWVTSGLIGPGHGWSGHGTLCRHLHIGMTVRWNGGEESRIGGNDTNIRTSNISQARVAMATPVPLIIVATPEGGIDYESAVLINIYRQVNPSVVNITGFTTGSSLDTVVPHNFGDQDLLPLGGGSGFVWDLEGHIVTNHHVVDAVDQLQVTFADGTVALAEVVGSDVSSDLAVLRIDPDGYDLQPVRQGEFDDVQVGMRVAAIGNPFGLAGNPDQRHRQRIGAFNPRAKHL